jgi:RimJ/RimL family protein N-acetyltransferase
MEPALPAPPRNLTAAPRRCDGRGGADDPAQQERAGSAAPVFSVHGTIVGVEVALEPVPLTDEHAQAMLAWAYEPPYDFYDFAADPDDARELLDPALRERYLAVLGDRGELIGFWYVRPRGREFEVGLGLRPDLTGRGLGTPFVEAELAYARRQWRPETFRLYVAAWNERARRVYERLGFREVARAPRSFERFGEIEFVEMEREA